MITAIFLVALLLTAANWILVPCTIEKNRHLALKIYTPSAFMFSLFTIYWGVHYGVPL